MFKFKYFVLHILLFGPNNLNVSFSGFVEERTDCSAIDCLYFSGFCSEGFPIPLGT